MRRFATIYDTSHVFVYFCFIDEALIPGPLIQLESLELSTAQRFGALGSSARGSHLLHDFVHIRVLADSLVLGPIH